MKKLDYEAIARGEVVKYEMQGSGGAPSIAITAGIHGNEQTGIYTAMLLMDMLETETLLGDALIMPVCNPSAFLCHTREAKEDGVDLNRAFPGTNEGYTPALAKMIYAMTASYEYIIDLHCCGIFGSTYVMSGYTRLPFQLDMARDLGISPLCHTNGPLSAGQLYLEAGYNRGQKGLLIELPGGQPGGVVFEAEARACALRILAFMKARGLVAGEPSPADPVEICGVQLRHTAANPGLFVPCTHNGARVAPTDTIGTLDGERIAAGCDGIVTYTAPYLYAGVGERLVNIAPVGTITTM